MSFLAFLALATGLAGSEEMKSQKILEEPQGQLVAMAERNLVRNMLQKKIITFTGPILFKTAAGATGQRALTCVTAAAHAYVKGWLPFIP